MTNQFLENERIALEEKITEARNKGNENTYKNLIQAYERVLELIRKENKWEDMYSHYYEGDEKLNGENEYVATWKQNWNGDVKDHKIYKIEKEISEKSKYDLYFDVSKNDKGENSYMISYKGEIHNLTGFDVNYIAEYIKKLCRDDEFRIYGDLTCFGIAVADRLAHLGCKVNNTTINSANVSQNGGAIHKRELKYYR